MKSIITIYWTDAYAPAEAGFMLARRPKPPAADPRNSGGKGRARHCLGAAFCLALLAAYAARAQKIHEVTSVRMEDDPDHMMVWVSCRINSGRRPYVCVIDSGASITIVSDRVVEAEGPVVEMTTGNGVVRVHQREVSLTIADGLNVKSKAFVQSMMLQGVDVLVGQDVLRQFRSVIFNYETRKVEFQR